MLIIGVDPGPTTCGAVVFQAAGWRVLEANPAANLIELGVLVDRYSPDALALEIIRPMGQVLGHALLETVRTQFAVEMLADGLGVQRVDLGRVAIKTELCRSASARDPQVRAALVARCCERHGIQESDVKGRKAAPGPLYGVSSHCWAALAAAVVAVERLEPDTPASYPQSQDRRSAQ